MSHRSKIIKEAVEVIVSAANQTFKESFEVDKHAGKILGILLISDYDELLYYRGTQRIKINEMEIFPEGYESKLLMQGLNVSVNERMVKLGEDILPGNRKVEIDYTDTNHASAPFTPYKVKLYVYSEVTT
jgi:hypothetical protein